MAEIFLQKKIIVHQVFEGVELLGFETRNKYQFISEGQQVLAYAAEQRKDGVSFIMRQIFGHWRKMVFYIFDTEKNIIIKARQPFRFYFQRLEIENSSGVKLGSLQQRFSLLSKRFDLENKDGLVIMEVSSPLWKPWTFHFIHQGKHLASIYKKWGGLFSEMFTKKDTFTIEYSDDNLSIDEKKVIMTATIFIDLRYFEKQGSAFDIISG